VTSGGLLGVVLPPERRRPLKLLCLGAHADDIEIGCGGTVLRLAAEVPDLVVRWIVFSGAGLRGAEARNSAAAFLENTAEKQIEVLGFHDGYFPFQGADIKDHFEDIKRFRSVIGPDPLPGRRSSGPPAGGRTHQ
jgi:LmbE family N-acetylglucosaminyl deacetylase